jgi:hypothetical protein
MFNTFKNGINKLQYHQIQINATILFKNLKVSDKLLFKLSGSKFFSTKLKDNLTNISSSEKSKDFFESNFSIEKSTEHISTVNHYLFILKIPV